MLQWRSSSTHASRRSSANSNQLQLQASFYPYHMHSSTDHGLSMKDLPCICCAGTATMQAQVTLINSLCIA